MIDRGRLMAHSPLGELTSRPAAKHVRLRSPDVARFSLVARERGLVVVESSDSSHDHLGVESSRHRRAGVRAPSRPPRAHDRRSEPGGDVLDHDHADRGGPPMTALIRSELIQLRTLRSTWLVPLTLLGLVGLITRGLDGRRRHAGWDHTRLAARTPGRTRRRDERGCDRAARGNPSRWRIPLRDDHAALSGRTSRPRRGREGHHLYGRRIRNRSRGDRARPGHCRPNHLGQGADARLRRGGGRRPIRKRRCSARSCSARWGPASRSSLAARQQHC